MIFILPLAGLPASFLLVAWPWERPPEWAKQ